LIGAFDRTFVGRAPELTALDERQANGGRLLITGGPGVGKSALLAHWIGKRRAAGQAVAAHFFSERQGLTSLSGAYINLLRQLLAHQQISGPLPPENDEPVLRARLYEALLQRRDGPARSPLILAIDGLDEAEARFEPPPGRLPPGVFIVASARDNPQEFTYPWIEIGTQLPLSALEPAAVAEWMRTAGSGELKSYAERPDFVDRVLAKTDGLTLYLEYAIDDMAAAEREGRTATEVLEQIPASFEAYVRRQLGRLANDPEALRDHKFQDLFAMLAVAAGPLPEDAIEKLTGIGAIELQRLPWRIARWLRMVVLPERLVAYAFSHPLLAAQFASVLGDQARRGHDRLIEFCRGWRLRDQ
jgi:hypothetical protein